MKKRIYFPSLLIALCLSQVLSAQGDNVDVVKPSKWEMYMKLGTGISNEKRPQYSTTQVNYEGWYEPGISASIGAGISRSIGSNFRLSTGINYDYYSIKSTPRYLTSVGPGYYTTSTGVLPVISTDDKLSQLERHRGYLSIPIIFEYYGERTWAPYFKLGVIFSHRVYDRHKSVYVGTRQESYSNATTILAAHTFSGLFGTFGGGVQYKKNHRTFTFGLTGNAGIVAFRKSTYISNIPLPNSLQIEVGVHQELFGKRRKKSTSL